MTIKFIGLPREFEKAFERIGTKLIIFISSLGEPFLYPNFLEILTYLTKNFYISLNTNLTHKNIYELPRYVDAKNLLAVHAAYHIIELEKKQFSEAKEEFINKVLFLKQQKIEVVVSYIAFPPLLNRIEADFKYLQSKGVDKIMAKPFIGNYANKTYPKAYSAKQWDLLKNISTSINGIDFLDIPESFEGRMCDSGKRSFFINQKGGLYRCMSSEIELGNVFDDRFVLMPQSDKCICKKYVCRFECVMGSRDVKQSIFDRLFKTKRK